MKNLSFAESEEIVNLVASVNGVDKSAVQFINNNSMLTVTSANGFQQILNIADYAATNK
ncbi:hypothetical protein SDC49_06465 [Lactobacillus sp. R2/2]|nr:hypothetical protein [Lactobacillus sp. R2/2]